MRRFLYELRTNFQALRLVLQALSFGLATVSYALAARLFDPRTFALGVTFFLFGFACAMASEWLRRKTRIAEYQRELDRIFEEKWHQFLRDAQKKMM